MRITAMMLLLSACMTVFCGCGRNSSKTAPAQKTSGQSSRTELVDFRVLREILPEHAGSMKRVSVGGERNTALGLSVSLAEAAYTNEAGQGMIVARVMDMGGVSSVTSLAQFAWVNAKIDRETKTAVQRTLTFSGHNAYEDYDKESKAGNMQVLIKDRFLVEADSDGMDMESVRGFLRSLDLSKLAAMK